METMEQPNLDQNAAIGEVIVKAREVETKLHTVAGGEVTGIHALTELLGDKLPEELKRRLHFIATVRNQAAHEADFAMTFADFTAFQKTAGESMDALNRLFPGTGENSAETASPALDVAVEKESIRHWARKVHIFGFFPLIGVLNLVRILLACVWEQIGVLVLILFYLASIPMVAEGIRKFGEKQELLYIGGGVALAVYVITVFVAYCVKSLRMPKFIIWVPGLSIIYLVTLFAHNLAWRKFLVSAAGIIALAVAFCGVLNQRWDIAGYALGAEWLFSVIASLAFPVAKVEEFD